MSDLQPCDVVIAQFVFGAQKCGNPSVTTAKCEEWPRCTADHPVCKDHSFPQEIKEK